MQPFDDMTPEELDQRNAPAIAFLHQATGQGKASFDTIAMETQSMEEAQVIANVRQRLLALEREEGRDSHAPHLSLVAQKTSSGSQGNTTRSTPGIYPLQERRNWQNRLSLLVAVAILLLLVASSVFVFNAIQLSSISRTPTPRSQTGASTTQTATPLSLQQEAQKLVQRLHDEATAWGNAHPYHDRYDGHTYALDGAYLQNGLGAFLQEELASAHTKAEYEGVIQAANNALFNLHMLEADYNDHTPYNLMHTTDMQMLKQYHLQGQIVFISLVEQAMRVYQNGQLVRAFSITTARPELPSTPGIWQELSRFSPTTLVSAFPPSSPYWFPQTPVHYAILYQKGGHFIVDSFWRGSYGPGTQFPHRDATGNSIASSGTDGGIDMAEQDAAWLYTHTSLKTSIVIY